MVNPSMTKGKVVLVPFPFDDLTADKVRPALCLTDPTQDTGKQMTRRGWN